METCQVSRKSGKMLESHKNIEKKLHLTEQRALNFNFRETRKKTEMFTQSIFNIFVLHKPFSGFYKGNRRQNKENYTDLKKIIQKWFVGLCVFPGLMRSSTI